MQPNNSDAVDALHAYVSALFGPPSKNERKLVDDLTYINYAHNRDMSPDITPERWAKIYPNAEALEARYQAEKAKP